MKIINFVLKLMNLVASGIEMSDIVMEALNFCQGGPGTIPGLNAILQWGLLGLFPAPRGVFQQFWVPLTIEIMDLISSDLR